jgi:hypothetical protein
MSASVESPPAEVSAGEVARCLVSRRERLARYYAAARRNAHRWLGDAVHATFAAQGLGATDRLVLLALCARTAEAMARDDVRYYLVGDAMQIAGLSVAHLARACGLSPRGVQLALGRLAARGAIRREHTPGRAATYWVIPDALRRRPRSRARGPVCVATPAPYTQAPTHDVRPPDEHARRRTLIAQYARTPAQRAAVAALLDDEVPTP